MYHHIPNKNTRHEHICSRESRNFHHMHVQLHRVLAMQQSSITITDKSNDKWSRSQSSKLKILREVQVFNHGEIGRLGLTYQIINARCYAVTLRLHKLYRQHQNEYTYFRNYLWKSEASGITKKQNYKIPA